MTDTTNGTAGVSREGAQLDGGVWEIELSGGDIFYVWIESTGSGSYKEHYRTKTGSNISFPLSHSTYTSVSYSLKNTSVSTLSQYNTWLNNNAPSFSVAHTSTVQY